MEAGVPPFQLTQKRGRDPGFVRFAREPPKLGRPQSGHLPNGRRIGPPGNGAGYGFSCWRPFRNPHPEGPLVSSKEVLNDPFYLQKQPKK